MRSELSRYSRWHKALYGATAGLTVMVVAIPLTGAIDATWASSALAGPPPRAESAPGKPQQLTSPDQTPEQVYIADDLRFTREPFDALIVAAARTLALPLLTRDADIRASQLG